MIKVRDQICHLLSSILGGSGREKTSRRAVTVYGLPGPEITFNSGGDPETLEWRWEERSRTFLRPESFDKKWISPKMKSCISGESVIDQLGGRQKEGCCLLRGDIKRRRQNIDDLPVSISLSKHPGPRPFQGERLTDLPPPLSVPGDRLRGVR